MKTLFSALALCLFFAARSCAERPDWLQDPCSGLGRDFVLCGIGSSEIKPDEEITSAIAVAFAVKDISSILSLKVSQLSKNYAEKTQTEDGLAESATKNTMKSPLGFALFKTYSSNDAAQTLTLLSVEIDEIADPDFAMFWQTYTDVKKKELYARALVPMASVRYLQFAADYGKNEAEILGRLITGGTSPGGDGRGRTDRLHELSAQLETLRAAMKSETARLRKFLGEDARVWPQKSWKLYSRNLGRGARAENELVLQSADGKTAWVEHQPTGGASLLSQGRERRFVYNRSGGNWREKEAE